MHIKTGDPQAALIVVVSMHGDTISHVFAANTEEGWLDCYATERDEDKQCSRVVVDSKLGELVTYRVHRWYELVDWSTGEVLATSSSPKIKGAK